MGTEIAAGFEMVTACVAEVDRSNTTPKSRLAGETVNAAIRPAPETAIVNACVRPFLATWTVIVPFAAPAADGVKVSGRFCDPPGGTLRLACPTANAGVSLVAVA